MTSLDAPVGAMDSGVGGLTVVQNLRAILPGEDVLFFGDSANCPYGNRSEDEVFELAMNMVRCFETEGVKCIVIACNTMSAIVDRLKKETSLKLFSIVESAAEYVTGLGIDRAGLIATECAVNSRIFNRCLSAANPGFDLRSRGCHNLAMMIDRGIIEGPELERELCANVDPLLEGGDVSRLILGCTHYPIALETIRKCYPRLELIDAAKAQAETVAAWLRESSLLREGTSGSLHIRTSGGREVFDRVCALLNISGYEVETLKSFKTQISV